MLGQIRSVTVAASGNGWLARALGRNTSLPVSDEEPPAQFLDVADLAEDQPEDAAGVAAERHADPDLAAALRDLIGQHPVEAHGGQEQGVFRPIIAAAGSRRPGDRTRILRRSDRVR